MDVSPVPGFSSGFPSRSSTPISHNKRVREDDYMEMLAEQVFKRTHGGDHAGGDEDGGGGHSPSRTPHGSPSQDGSRHMKLSKVGITVR